MDSLLVKYIKSDYLAGTMNGELYLNSMGFFGRGGKKDGNEVRPSPAFTRDNCTLNITRMQLNAEELP